MTYTRNALTCLLIASLVQPAFAQQGLSMVAELKNTPGLPLFVPNSTLLMSSGDKADLATANIVDGRFGQVLVWDWKNNQTRVIWEREYHTGIVGAVSRDGSKGAFGGGNTLCFVDFPSLKVRDVDVSKDIPDGVDFIVTSLCFSKRGDVLWYCCGFSRAIDNTDQSVYTHQILRWDLRSNKKAVVFQRSDKSQRGIRFLVSDDEQEILVHEALKTPKVHRIAAESGKVVDTIELPKSSPLGWHVSSKRDIVILAYDKGVQKRGPLQNRFESFLKADLAPAIVASKDDRILIGGKNAKKDPKQPQFLVVDYNVDDGKEVIYEVDGPPAGGIAVSSDDRFLAIDVGYVTRVYELPRSPR